MNGRSGTKVTLLGVGASEKRTDRHQLEDAVRDAAIGFPIQVTRKVNASDVAILTNRDSTTAMAGNVHLTVPGFGTVYFRPEARYETPIFYLQGLQVEAGRNPSSTARQIVVHLDSQSFDARMPDRAVLRDVSLEDLYKMLKVAEPALAEMYFHSVEGKIVDELAWNFVADHQPELAKQCTSVPGRLFYEMNELSSDDCIRDIFDQTSFGSTSQTALTAEDFQDTDGRLRRCMLLSELPSESEDNHGGVAYLLSQAQEQHGLRFLTFCGGGGSRVKCLPDWMPQAIEITGGFTDDQVYATAAETGQPEHQKVSTCFDHSAVDVYRVQKEDGYVMHLRDKDGVEITHAIIDDYAWFDGHTRQLWVIAGGALRPFATPDHLFQQDENYVDGEEYNYHWDQEGIDQACNRLELQLATAFGANTDEADKRLQDVVLEAINTALRPYQSMLGQRDFAVSAFEGGGYRKVVIE